MATRDKDHHQADRYRYSYYDSTRAYGKHQYLKVEYNSDDEYERRRQRGQKRETSTSYFQAAPSPPPLNRNRSTGRDRRASDLPDPQRPPRVRWDEKVAVIQDLPPDEARRPYGHATSRPGVTPEVIISEVPRDSGRSWSKSSVVTTHLETTPRSTSPSSSGSGVLGEKTYQYEKLRPQEFRLVRLYSKKMSTVKCEIIHSSLKDPPSYTAISYAWGDTDDRRRIQIGKISISVAVSLFGALDAVRKREGDILVWVDALCIDQQNRAERGQQVQLMTEIYAKATRVAIWLGPSENDSQLAEELLQDIVITENNPKEITSLLLSPTRQRAVEAVARLFQRDYWQRLWVVQEVFNAKAIKVYCGDSAGLPWGVYKRAARIFQRHKRDLDFHFSASRRRYSSVHGSLNYSHALAYEGPNSLLDLDSVYGLGEASLLNVLRGCRRKLTSEPRDRVFGILGVLPTVVRQEFPVDYNLSVKEIYTNVVDFLLNTTERLDILCESIHFPRQSSVVNLPSWVPDWSQNPDITALGYTYDFAAAGDTKAEWGFLGERRNELEISAVYVDTVWKHGIAVGTRCTLADYLMAFLHWRAFFLDSMSLEDRTLQKSMEEEFCRTLCLGQVPLKWKPDEWVEMCYRVFATQLRNRLPRLPLDDALRKYADVPEDAKFDYREFLQYHFGSRMMGRSFFLTERNRLGMGTGAMLPNDIIVVPLGCRTPIIIRAEDSGGRRFRFVGDAYLDGYMDGKAIAKWKATGKEIEKFVLV
ncbi:heterokaryon incompatibility protein-domain-containing protein [Nemania abortiva]|nr:heterokaryon incompatibility protein-domain-containing protein [Nemania abortiva]